MTEQHSKPTPAKPTHHFERERLAAIVESSQDAIISKTIDGVITSWNAAAERLFGYTADEAVGQNITLIIPPDRRGEEAEILGRLRRGERIEHYDTVRMRKDGRPVEIALSISPLRDDSGRVIGASKIARDISARRVAEQTLREADRRKDDFLAVLAHELRNPLAPIANSLEILQAPDLDPTTVRRLAAVARRQVGHLVRIVDDLMEISRFTRGKITLQEEVLLLSAVVDDAVEISRPLIEDQGHQLEVVLPTPQLVVRGDRTRLSQILSNLLNNAAKYTPGGGRIRLLLAREGDQAAVRVIDNGAGIAPDMLTRIFDMFTQADRTLERTQGGLGIGLSLAKRLVELHGGTIEARSGGLGRGSEFVVRLPLVLGAQRAHAPDRRPDAVPARRRVLVADDNPDAVRTLEVLLHTLGQDVVVAANGEEAVTRAAERRPDLMLIDLGMPRLDGFGVAQQIRGQEWGRDVLLVALTGWGQEADRDRSRQAGFDRHLVKPVDVKALREVLALPVGERRQGDTGS